MIFKFTICKNPFLLFGLVANINGNRCEHLPAVVNYKILKSIQKCIQKNLPFASIYPSWQSPQPKPIKTHTSKFI